MAWDDDKSAGDLIQSADWDAMVADQKTFLGPWRFIEVWAYELVTNTSFTDKWLTSGNAESFQDPSGTRVERHYQGDTSAVSGLAADISTSYVLIDGDGSDWDFIVFFGSNVTSSTSVEFGLITTGDQGAVPWPAATHKASFRYDNTGNVLAVTSDGTEGTTDTGQAYSGSQSLYRIQRSGTDIRFYIDGTSVATRTTNLPTDNLAIAFTIVTRAAAVRSTKVGGISLMRPR